MELLISRETAETIEKMEYQNFCLFIHFLCNQWFLSTSHIADPVLKVGIDVRGVGNGLVVRLLKDKKLSVRRNRVKESGQGRRNSVQGSPEMSMNRHLCRAQESLHT